MFLNYKIAKKCPKKSEICAYRDSNDGNYDEEFYKRKIVHHFTLQV